MDVVSIVDQVKHLGFVNAKQVALSSLESQELASLSRDIYHGLSHDHPDYLPAKGGGAGMRGIPQHHPRIAQIIDRVVSNSEVRSILESVLGQDYKIWQIDYRRSVKGDEGLALHQDAPGQLNICIMLSNNIDYEGSTVFLTGSHLLPKRIADLKVKLSPSLMETLRLFFSHLSGNVGDIAFFFNRTWHGRYPNNSCRTNEVILLGLFPVGASMSLLPPYVNWSADFLESIQGTELSRLVDPAIGTEVQKNGLHKIILQKNVSNFSLPFSMEIESKLDCKINIKLKIFVGFLRVAMGFGRPFKKLLRNFSGSLKKNV